MPTQKRVSGGYPLVSSSGIIDTHCKSAVRGPGVVTGRSGSIGSVFYVEEDFWPLNTVLYVKDFHGNDPRFVFYLLNQFDLKRFSSGAGVPTLNRNFVHDELVIVPSLSEQQRVVGILDQAFESIATAKANAEKSLQNARALFGSHLLSVFTQNAQKWKKRNLGEFAEIQSGGTPSISEKTYWKGSIPWYSSGELNGIRTGDPERQITKAGLDNSNAKLFPAGSLLIGMYDTAALKMSILDREATFNQAIAGVKPNAKIEIEFVLHAINANKPTLLLERRGVRQKNLSLGKIKEIKIPLPALPEQRTIVARLREVLGETQHLESTYKRKLDALGGLKKSLLHSAFQGAL